MWSWGTYERELAIEVAGVDKHDPRTCEECIAAREKLAQSFVRKPMKRRSKKGKKYDLAFKAATIVVKLRSGRRCEYLHDKVPDGIGFQRCTWNTGDLPPHHRKRRTQGGSNDPVNLMDLCVIHHDEVHGNPLVSVARGYLIPSHEPETPF